VWIRPRVQVVPRAVDEGGVAGRGDAPCYYAVIGRVMTLRATNLRTRRPRSAVQGRLAPA